MKIKNKTAGGFAHVPTANTKLQINYRRNRHLQQGQFNRSQLPIPLSVLNRLGIHPGKINRKGFWTLRCPIHKDGKESTPSLNLHHLEGYFRCHACGIKGGDILAFYMLMTHMSFVNAARQLGAWEEKS